MQSLVITIVGLLVGNVMLGQLVCLAAAESSFTASGGLSLALTLATNSPENCGTGLTHPGVFVLVEYRQVEGQATGEWQLLKRINLNSTKVLERAVTEVPLSHQSNSSASARGHTVQLRVVQREHGGGLCNCWELTESLIVAGNSTSINLHLSRPCDIQHQASDNRINGGILFCGGSASVPRGLVYPPVSLISGEGKVLNCSSLNSSTIAGGSGSPPVDCTGEEPRLQFSFVLHLLPNVCDASKYFDEGVEVAIGNWDKSGHWIPLMFFANSLNRSTHDINIGDIIDGMKVNIRGYTVPIQIQNTTLPMRVNLAVCGENIVRKGLQIRWLQTTSVYIAASYKVKDAWTLSDVAVTNPSCVSSSERVRPIELNENVVRNSDFTRICSGRDELVLGATCSTIQCDIMEGQITVSRMATTAPLILDHIEAQHCPAVSPAPLSPNTLTSSLFSSVSIRASPAVATETPPTSHVVQPTRSTAISPTSTSSFNTSLNTSSPSSSVASSENQTVITASSAAPDLSQRRISHTMVTHTMSSSMRTHHSTVTRSTDRSTVLVQTTASSHQLPAPSPVTHPPAPSPVTDPSAGHQYEEIIRQELEATHTSIIGNIEAHELLTAIHQQPAPEAAMSLRKLVTNDDSVDETTVVYLLANIINQASGFNTTHTFTQDILEVENRVIENTASNSKSNIVAGSTLLYATENLAFNVFTPEEEIPEKLNIKLTVHDISTYTEQEYFTTTDVRESVIRVPTELLGNVGNGTGPVTVVSVYYRNMTGLLPGTLPGGSDSVLGSPVLSTSLQCGERVCDTSSVQLSLPVIITLQHTGHFQNLIEHDEESKVTCVFWRFITKQDSLLVSGRWDTEGCVRNDSLSNSTHTVCECTHLTNFAILLSARPLPLPSSVALSLSIIGYIGVGLSVLAMLATIVSLLFLRSLWSIRNFIHINLCVSLILAQLTFVIGVTPHEGGEGVGPGCRTAAVIMHYLFLVSFMWMLMEGVVLYVALVRVFVKQQRRYMIGFFVFSYGAPLLYMVLCVPLGLATPHESGYGYGYIQDDNETTDTPNIVCWLNPYSHFVWAFIAPVLVVILVNVGFFIMALVIMHRHSKRQTHKSKMKSAKNWIKGSVSLVVVMGITWIIGILVFEVPALFPLAYIFTIFVAFQGVAIFIIFVLLSKQVREAYSKWWKVKVAKSEILSKRFGEWTTSSSGGQTSTRMGASSPNGSTLPRTSISQLEASTAPSYADYDTNGVTETKKQVPTLTRQGTSFDVTYVTTPTKKSFFDSEESSEGANGHVGNGHTSEFNVDYAESAQTESTTV